MIIKTLSIKIWSEVFNHDEDEDDDDDEVDGI